MREAAWKACKAVGKTLLEMVLIAAFMMAVYTVAYLIAYQEMPRWK